MICILTLVFPGVRIGEIPNSMAKKLKEWFDGDLALLLGKKLEQVDPSFRTDGFVHKIKQLIPDLELKGRLEAIADVLDASIAGDFSEKAKTFHGILGPSNPNETGMFTEFYWLMPVAKWVEKYGLDDWGVSMKLIAEITKRHTSEFAIRPFIEHYPKKTLNKMVTWAGSSNFHLRRLASEGGRPRLPWASKLTLVVEEPELLFPILEKLKDDPIKYVQKSVANCMNDIGKDHPELLESIILKWSRDLTPQRQWIIKHSLRNWIKKENTFAMEWKSKFLG